MVASGLGATGAGAGLVGTTMPVAATGTGLMNAAAKGGAAAGAGLGGLAVGLLAAGGGAMLMGIGLDEGSKGAERFFGTLKTLEWEQVEMLGALLGTMVLFGGGAAFAAAGAAALVALGGGLAVFGKGLQQTTGQLETMVDLLESIQNLEGSKTVQFEKIMKNISDTSEIVGDTGFKRTANRVSMMMHDINTANSPSATSSGGGMSEGKTHTIILEERDSFGNKRELKRLILEVINNEIEVKNN